MSEWFECKVKYERTMQDGALKKVCEPYLVEALNFTEAERRIIEEVSPYISGEFEVTNITRARFAEIFDTLEDSADKWYKAKLVFITLDEKSGKEKKTSHNMMVQAASFHDIGEDCERLPIFQFKGHSYTRQWFWLRAVASASYFALTNTNGGADHYAASGADGGVRPLICVG